MKRITIILLCLIFLIQLVKSQNEIKISGFVKDFKSGEVMIGATIFDSINKTGTYTDNNGYFTLSVKPPCVIRIAYLGYTSFDTIINSTSNLFLNIHLKQNLSLEEVVVTGHTIINANINTLKIKELGNLPSLGGKIDIGRVLQNLPGIKGQKEGSSTFLVRGGDPGQNMYLFDNVPILYVNHLAGFFSVFNPDIINNIEVYKGDFPPKFGGKISSYVDITQKEGNNSEYKGNFSIGLTDFAFTIEGPTKLKNSSFIITARKTLIDALLFSVSSTPSNNSYILYGFHDINGKYTWKPDNKNTMSYNLYYGDDYLHFWKKKNINDKEIDKHHSSYIWGNLMNSVQWKSIFNSKTYFILGISHTSYRTKDVVKYNILQEANTTKYNYKFLSSVDDISIRSLLKYDLLKFWNLHIGIETSFKNYLPMYSEINHVVKQNQESWISELCFHLNNEIKIKKIATINLGARITYYKNDIYQNFTFEPRTNLKINFTKNQNLFVAYSRTSQNNHLLFSTASLLQNEIWFPANGDFIPSIANHYSVGWEGTFFNNKQQSSIVIYYKDMSNLCAYKEGYSILKGDLNWMSKIEKNGTGISYGIEVFTKINIGKIDGTISYTYSKTTRKFENINYGKVFIFEFDRPHDFSISINYKISNQINCSLFWTFQTGLPYTPVVGKQLSITEDGFIQTLIYGDKNSERLKNYHRLDVSLNYTYINKRDRKTIWSFSLYNSYNRKNPYYYYYNVNATSEIYLNIDGVNGLPLKLYQISYFPIIPSFSYRVFFDKTNYPKLKNINIKKWLYYEN